MSIITLPITSSAKILVKEGDHITDKTTLAKFDEVHNLETIHLAKLLGVNSAKIAGYLQRKVGGKIHAGDIIAEKKGFFSSTIVKSPIDGELLEMDLSKGTISLTKYSIDAKKDLVSPVSGKIMAIGKFAIEIEVKNQSVKGIKGDGKDVMGELKYLKGDVVGVLESHDNLEESVVLCKYAQEATLVKFSVIGVKGMVMQKIKGDTILPWILVEENIFEKLINCDKKKVWLRPNQKQIVILD